MSRGKQKTLSNYVELIKLIEKIDNDPESTEKGRVKLPQENIGPSGQKFRSLVSELVSKLPAHQSYLEIGIFKGRTILTSAAENPDIKHIGVDNFSQFDPDGVNLDVITTAISEMELRNLEIKETCFKDYLLERAESQVKDVGLFFYDAIHDYRSQLMALYNSMNFLAPGGIILVDDTNYAHVRYATYDFVDAFRDFKIVFESYTHKHPSLMDEDERIAATAGWWNGVHVIVHDPDNQVVGIEPRRDEDTEKRFERTVTLTPTICPDLSQKIAAIV